MHIPVLLHEVIDGLRLTANANCLDATLGGGGHALEILRHTSPNGKLLGCDRDRSVLLIAAEHLEVFGSRFISVCDSYANILKHPESLREVQPLQAILLDLGLSSLQLDDESRGFAFRFDAPLDMRFDQTHDATASELINSWPEEELRRALKEYGEERYATKIAAAIVRRRKIKPLKRVQELVELIEETIAKPHRAHIHPATRTFQALRIAVNHELEHLQKFLPIAMEILAPNGRLAIISYHSLEDRLVKEFLRRESTDCLCPPEFPTCQCHHRAHLRRITKRPIRTSLDEVKQNPRSRSARLRVAEKI